ncbi:cation diffusion facilitator family transporter [Nocardiopsis dassonvillei]|uniref:Cation diffusion facilitator family transporter n=1 Tax=Nocardiopsis dassonvillei (strain ATCC 23218 / DSM 43111 / CIP 107115 / JCM 7437 / KCTC 9190 / NBRC 14626 / NCTC 10488 / NRRL B-5397 / IMRU 509) TaxID=446468 RepID=D7B860_NOCDD|nr:cation diffusion facilitator family transporter [Nocardiopsis dassonvillei]ADH70368.1 cation diffusion facilitator family transporter [Nocardiopsis dassonvillei subsp. dassonvillei DSM 43111]APC33656.1 cation transporter [Nocardiopsis dassonvillei]NKY77000.1 cation diffusion facilitator family transporter [Nocardiopsis dassonvillei]VEI91276.1 zinc transporter ZitB [Nocardiopsis dassonvillei]
MSVEGSTRAVVTALCANLGIAATKFVAYLLTGSSSMMAESIHSVADSSNQALLLIGGKRARRGATEEHPFGYGRERYVYAFMVAIVLFSLGGLFALYEAWHKISHPEPITSWQWVPVAVLLVAIVLESFAMRTAVKESNAVRGKAGWVQFVRRSKSPELPVILLEDAGALLGLVFALAGVSLTLFTGDGLWDGLGTAAIGVLLVVIAVVLAVEVKSLLIGESATSENVRAIRRAIESVEDIDRLIHMRTQHVGPEELLVAAKVAVDAHDDAGRITRAINEAEERIRTAVPIATLVYIEPDLFRGGASPEASPGTVSSG